MPYKVAFVSLGCAKNLVNTEQMMALCRRAGYDVTGETEGADVAVLNTCGFIESAKSEAINSILEDAGHRQLYRCGLRRGGADGGGAAGALWRYPPHL